MRTSRGVWASTLGEALGELVRRSVHGYAHDHLAALGAEQLADGALAHSRCASVAGLGVDQPEDVVGTALRLSRAQARRGARSAPSVWKARAKLGIGRVQARQIAAQRAGAHLTRWLCQPVKEGSLAGGGERGLS